ncbi:MAG: type IX secretion system sortase PorU [Crocinitomicaceae bacterium]
MTKTSLLFFLISWLLFGSIAFAQEKIEVSIDWLQPKEINQDNKIFKIPQIKDQAYSLNKPNFYWVKELDKSLSYSFELESYETLPSDETDAKFLMDQGIEIPKDFQPDFVVRNGGGKQYAVIDFFPYLSENGTLKRIGSVNGVLTVQKKTGKPIQAKSFVTNSVLKEGSGSWYKISVTSDGIYKLDKPFLEACGIDVANLNPAHLNIFGNGDGMLPELNSVPRTDDLAKNAIQIIGDADGVFDDTDYVLFYGWGPHRWLANGTAEFQLNTNVYSDYSYYYINVNENDIPLRMSYEGSTAATPTHTITEMSARLHTEKDLTNLVKGGQRWYGDLFDVNLSYNYGYSIPNVVSSSPATFKIAIAGNSGSSAANSIKATIAGTTLFTENVPIGGNGDYSRKIINSTWANPSANFTLNLTVSRNSPSVLTYLDYININARRSLIFYGDEMSFRDLRSVGVGNVGKFYLSNVNPSVFIWDVTDRHQPKIVQANLVGTDYEFVLPTDEIKEFVASNGQNYATPTRVGNVDFQNLHALPQADMLIVSPDQFLSQANRLADLHRSEGLSVHVVTQDQIFNEYSSGMKDATAIRFFAKMFYDRGQVTNDPPKHLLLFGDGTFDHRNKVSNANYIMTYEVEVSEDHIGAMVSDDYFGMLDELESFSPSDMVDIGVGRLLVSSQQIAKEQVDKIEHYLKNGSSFYSDPGDCDCPTASTLNTFGDWRMKYVQISDDMDMSIGAGYDFVMRDLEPQVDIVRSYRKEMNVDKIYSDAYQQISGAGGQRYPAVNDAISDHFRRGSLLINYVGHGGEVGVAEERIITIPQINTWKNSNAFPLVVSATCEFTKYDDPDRVSAGELVSLNPNGGAIALMTTTRSVYFDVNSDTGLKFYKEVFLRDADSLPRTFGDIMMTTKNTTAASANKRSFTLIGDPALRIAMPRLAAKSDSIYREGSTNLSDTVRALDKITLVGHFEDLFGNVLTDFNGFATPTIFDKPKTEYTLAQDPGTWVVPYVQQKNALFKGQVTVKNGYFKMTFVVPKDIDFTYGNGKISLYGYNATTDAMGSDTTVIVGGINPDGIADDQGPVVELFMNDFSFVNGGLTNETPILLVKLFDENGINAVGNGIGHDLTAVVDANSAAPIILNEYYLSDLDTYKSGQVNYNMSKIAPGPHTLTFKAWDVNNNSTERTLEFVVKEKESPELSHVLNYPNPFTTSTQFFFEHNQVNAALESQIQIFSISGKLVKTINTLVNTKGFRTEGIPWDGKDDFGDQLAKGVYVYRLKIKTDDGGTAEKLEKLVILK